MFVNPVLALPLYRTSIGKKMVMAVTGFVGVGYALLHMYGNLKVFAGREQFNAYAEFIRSVGEPLVPHMGVLWMIRLVVLVCVVLHIVSAVLLTRQDRAARPVAYAYRATVQASYAARTMRWGGTILLLFLCYHILHMTLGTIHPQFAPGDVYHNVIVGFQSWPATLVYVGAMLAFGLHLYHGAWSMLQTLGLTNATTNRMLRGAALLLALVVTGGYCIVPLAVVLGFVQ